LLKTITILCENLSESIGNGSEILKKDLHESAVLELLFTLSSLLSGLLK